MMKKLTLNRETVVDLEKGLREAGGGVSNACSASCPQVCTFSGYRTCNTCGATCGTNLC